MQGVLSLDSNFVYVWHDNSGQSIPPNNKNLESSINQDGFVINIAANASIEQPLVIMSSCAKTNIAKNVINIGSNASVQIIEYLVSDDNDAQNSSSTVINCSDGAKLKHCVLQQAKQTANINQQSLTLINQQANTDVASNIFAFGGAKNNIELSIALNGENAKCQAAYLAYTNVTESQNVLLTINHQVPHCTSSTIARSVLKDKSATDFVGRIVVHPDAFKSFADLQIKNILCSTDAQACNRPELEIYNDDVHCSHGSSTGQINEEAIFYMRQRGISEIDAIAMIIAGFIQPAIDSCTIPSISAFMRSVIEGR